MKRYPRFYLAIASLILVACTGSQPAQQPTPQLKVVTLNDTFKTVMGQTVYVPVYSHIYLFVGVWGSYKTHAIIFICSLASKPSIIVEC
ncbi:hypothetical protein [Microseira sp. BLCC-F43]|jgi:hypothetical protein|uniref:hypothetical protein n=1 Tax=Microseira sp. BLCC-F43 TaxID=3153602 RepID=UPI0035B74792